MTTFSFVLLLYGYKVQLNDGEDGYIIASCLELPGCHAQGYTEQEALSNIEDAVLGYITMLEDEGSPVPLGENISTISPGATTLNHGSTVSNEEIEEATWQAA